MKNRVIGIMGIGAVNANWNADFEGNPQNHLGEFLASPFALKYAYRHYWKQKNEKVLFIKTFKNGKKGEIIPKSLDDILVDIIGTKSKEKEIQNKVFDYIDVASFGGLFASKKFKQAYTGAIQFGYGVNKYEDAETIRENVLSPFQNANKSDSKQSSLGSRAYLNEGHFFYDFVVNPIVYNEIEKENSKSYFTEEIYQKFKEASFQCANNLNSVAKKGCYNEFAMFVELKEGSFKLISNLTEKIRYFKNDSGKKTIDLSLIAKDLISIKEDIEKIEIYHNPTDTELIIPTLDNLEIKNILSEIDVVDFTELV